LIVTINTDASFSRFHKKGSFAFWIVCNNFKILKSGNLRGEISNPSIAEFKCIVNAFHLLFNEDLKEIKKIIVNTDCLNVIHVVNNSKAEISRYKLQYLFEILKTWKKTIAKYPKIEIEFRHVKAHTGANNARSYVNELCDSEAKKRLNELLITL
jgi:hypothetical protein